jgi:ribosomal-protein-alanine N-acetyltransferase
MEIKNEIRLAKDKDRYHIKSVSEKSLPIKYDIFYWSKLIANKKSFVSIVENKIIGYIAVRNDGCIVSFAILKEYQGFKLGRQLIETCIYNCSLQGLSNFYLHVDVNNIKAYNLYESIGFKMIKICENYYANGNNAYLMEK